MKKPIIVAAIALAASSAQPAAAQEIFGGVYGHDLDTPLNKGGFESGAAVVAGIRGDRMGSLRFIGSPSPYAFVSVSTSGETNLAAVGISWKIGDRVYVRPGIGLAIHDRSSTAMGGGLRRDFGSRLLFEPEIGVGVQISERLSAEAHWIHASHATLLSGQNPGMDNIGFRLNYRFR